MVAKREIAEGRAEHERRAAAANARRAQRGFSRADVRAQARKQEGLCWWCGADLDGKVWHVDHLVPLSRGGPNTKDNIVIACAECNLKKQALMPKEYSAVSLDGLDRQARKLLRLMQGLRERPEVGSVVPKQLYGQMSSAGVYRARHGSTAKGKTLADRVPHQKS